MSFSIEAGGALSIGVLFLTHLGLCAAYIQGGLGALTLAGFTLLSTPEPLHQSMTELVKSS